MSSKTAYLFPGQGSQSVGMAKDHYESNGVFKKMVDRADELLGFKLSDIMFDGPEESLKQTEFTQPAIFLHSVALFSTLNVKPQAVAGHSLGEFSALVACGAISFEDALLIVRKRGKLMQKAGTDNPGTMAAVIGIADEKIDAICIEATQKAGKVVVPANFNSPGQVVISGYEEAIDVAVALFTDAGAKMVKKLPVSGAFHSPLMQPAFDGLKDGLEKLSISTPICPIFSNFTAESTTEPEIIRENVLQQLMNPVKWTQTLKNMESNGFTHFVEVGPGKVLQGLVKRTISFEENIGHQ
jgi:[acyl-carrier-protein] S-malonyltransferase